MNMDSSSSSSVSSHQNWLGFSLSNHHHQHQMNTSQLCLFEAFNTSTTPPTSVSVIDRGHEHQDATDLSIFTRSTGVAGPKLEDFLGGGSTTAPPQPPPTQKSLDHHLHQFSTETPVTNNNITSGTNTAATTTLSDTSTTSEIYDSELKSIAASFLRGLSSSSTTTTTTTEQHHQQSDITHKQLILHHHQPLVHLSDQSAPRKAVDTFGQRTSIYRGVTRHRWTGRYEAHLWDNSCRREGQSRKGRQVYLGGYDKEEKAARAYDLAALKYWGPTTTTNFPICNYEKELEEMKHMTRQEFVASLRRKSSGFSRGASIYRGVTRHHQHGRWQARIGRVAGNKDLYLGTFSTQEEAAEAYDIAAIKFRGLNAVTNFDMSRYDVKSIANSNLPIGGISGNKSKNSSDSAASDSKSIDGGGGRSADDRDLSSASSSLVTFASHPTNSTSTLNFGMPIKQDPTDYWSNILGCQNTSNGNSITLNNTKSTNNNAPVAQSILFPSSSTANANGPPAFPSSSTAAFSMDLMNDNSESNNGLILNSMYNLQQQSGIGIGIGIGIGGGSSTSSSAIIPFGTPIALNSSGSNYEGNSSYGSWIAQSLHSLQSAKPNLSMFQTPIFGME